MATGRQMSKTQQLTLAAGVTTVAVATGLWLRRRRQLQDQTALLAAPGASKGLSASSSCSCATKAPAKSAARGLRVRILFGSTTGTTEKWAKQVANEVAAIQNATSSLEVVVEDLATFAFDALLVKATPPKSGCCSEEAPRDVVVVLLSTQAEGSAPANCEHFLRLLDDHVYDFRVDKTAMAHLGFAVLGFGSTEYEEGHYCTAASKVDEMLAKMSASRLLPLRKVTDTEDHTSQFQPWSASLLVALRALAAGNAAGAAAAAAETAIEDEDYESSSEGSEGAPDADAEQAAADLEDVAESSCSPSPANPQEPKEMLTGKMRSQLTKEGYKIIGSHSAVKLCRWTKHQLRGRGGCYKHSFYGISSYNCMEATPSLACANKCVFCWRHHKNPVGTSWKWRMDPPDVIVREGIKNHQQMIRECKGIPGVKKERFEEAMTVKHCALSLVGEPIMYPRINEMLDDLHRRKISTFLVTNAQFPEAIHSLKPITQLYVSVDAATAETLKAVDRPLFADFWERYLESLRAIRLKKQRTVYRLTLVKDHNMTAVNDYAKLVALGEPDFIEIKSVTFCGESKASSLNITHVPWHEEVKAFTEAMLAEEGLSENYELACEHQHSCIVLIAHKRFKINDQWHTWIDYDRFHQLVSDGEDFDAMDYMAPTPDWALYGSDEAGFDPKEKRVYHNRTVKRAKAGELSEEQLRHYPKGAGPGDV